MSYQGVSNLALIEHLPSDNYRIIFVYTALYITPTERENVIPQIRTQIAVGAALSRLDSLFELADMKRRKGIKLLQ